MSKMLLYEKKTFIPEKGVEVSTVSHDMDIGYGRCAETMVFPANENGPTDYSEVFFESHQYITNKETLDAIHERIVNEQRNG